MQILGHYEKLIIQWPFFLCLGFLLGRFVYIIVKAVRIHLHLQDDEVDHQTIFLKIMLLTFSYSGIVISNCYN